MDAKDSKSNGIELELKKQNVFNTNEHRWWTKDLKYFVDYLEIGLRG